METTDATSCRELSTLADSVVENFNSPDAVEKGTKLITNCPVAEARSDALREADRYAPYRRTIGGWNQNAPPM
jgi:hypothetical protein